jgi:hydrogenase maturation protease
MKTLVIGYGNSLRGDDGVGPLVAEQVAAWDLPDVRSLSVHQLTPELAAEMAQVEQVFFVDACVLEDLEDKCKIDRLFPTASPTSLDHTWSPNMLLYLAKTLYDAEPIAYHMLIPAMQFGYGETLSAIARNGTDWVIAKLASELRPNFAHILEKSIAGDPAKWTSHQSRTAMIRSPPD